MQPRVSEVKFEFKLKNNEMDLHVVLWMWFGCVVEFFVV